MDTPRLLTAANVREVFFASMYDNESTDEEKKRHFPIKGVRLHIGFHPDRLKRSTDRINDLIDCLPAEFFEGAGDSFLQACVDRSGTQWGEHENIDQLLCLGLAIHRIHFLIPRELWSGLPGGMPFFKVMPRVTINIPLRGVEAER